MRKKRCHKAAGSTGREWEDVWRQQGVHPLDFVVNHIMNMILSPTPVTPRRILVCIM